MKIALVTDDYIPYSTRIAGKMLHELSVCLNEMGHSVTVITPHFSNQKFIQEEIDNINIWRFKSGMEGYNKSSVLKHPKIQLKGQKDETV
ncbi:hypothetical protein MASR2M29_03810 [Spirochaetota bacterium]